MFIAYKTLWCTDIHYKMRTKVRIFFELTNHFSNFLIISSEVWCIAIGMCRRLQLITRHICILGDKVVHL